MSDDQLLSWLTWFFFVALFALVVRDALRRPHWTNLNLVLLFAMPTISIGIGMLAWVGLVRPGPIPNAINSTLLLAISYFMLRLVDDFIGAPPWLLHTSGVLFGLLAVGSFLFAPPRPPWVSLAQILYFVGLQLYAAVAFVRSALLSTGVTRRRMRTVALGSLLLGLTIIALTLVPLGEEWLRITELCALAASVSYFLGFAPPLHLRRSWQEPELRAFLTISNSLSQPVGPSGDLRKLERTAAATLGASGALIGLWDETRQQLCFTRDGEEVWLPADPATAAGQAFLSQRPQFSTYRSGGPVSLYATRLKLQPRAVLAAPISSGGRQFGVLAAYTQHLPLIVAEDLDLVTLLANQVAATLATRALAEELAHSRSTRLKDDFLSAAAHDLQTPLTSVLGQAQRIERRMRADPQAADYLPGVSLIAQEAARLRRIVYELLDAASAERGQLVGARERVDLAELTRETATRYDSPRHPCSVESDGPLVGSYDRQRIMQLVEHLLDNAVQYSPAGGPVTLSLRRDGATAVLAIHDQGIGIPPQDLPRIFERFFRGSNIDDRRYAGMGLSLFICRAIVEQHGGRITASSRPGQGSTFELTLPLASEEVAQYATS